MPEKKTYLQIIYVSYNLIRQVSAFTRNGLKH